MSWIIAAIAGGTAIYKGIRAEEGKGSVEDAEVAIWDIWRDKMDLLESQHATGMEEIGMGTNLELRKTQAFSDQAYSKSNLATVGSVQDMMQTQMRSLMAQHRTSSQKIMDTKKLGELRAEQERESELTALPPTDFWGGVFG